MGWWPFVLLWKLTMYTQVAANAGGPNSLLPQALNLLFNPRHECASDWLRAKGIARTNNGALKQRLCQHIPALRAPVARMDVKICAYLVRTRGNHIYNFVQPTLWP